MPVRVSPVLIGRDDLVALAARRLDAAAAGHGHLLLLTGEAGIGKTRLLAEIRARAAEGGFTVADAAAFPRDAEVAGGVLLDLAAAFGRDPVTASGGAALARRLRTGGAGSDAHRRRRLVVGDLADLIAQLVTLGRPLLVTLEDLHWADDLTLEVLDRVARLLPSSTALVVGAYRDDEPRAPTRPWRARLLARRLDD